MLLLGVSAGRKSLGLHEARDLSSFLFGGPAGRRDVGLAAAHQRGVQRRRGADGTRGTEEYEVLRVDGVSPWEAKRGSAGVRDSAQSIF